MHFQDDYSKVPYCYKGDQWLSYDDEESIAEKAKFVRDNNLGGAMVWSIDTDDFNGFCGRKNGLIETVYEVWLSGTYLFTNKF